MAEARTLWRRFLDRPNDDRVKVFGVAFLTALFSALVVSMASVTLKPLQEAHLEAEQAARMEAMLDTLPGLRDVMAEMEVEALETRLVDLETGTFVAGDAAAYDITAAASDPETSVAIPSEADVAGLGRRAAVAPVYLLERGGDVLLIVLPVTGKGYASTIRANLALEADMTTVAALIVTEQGETPGLGARIETPEWQSLWIGKEVANAAGEIVIDVVRGSATGPHEVDALSGATVTSNGVANMLRYWLGDHGYGPLIDRLRAEGV